VLSVKPLVGRRRVSSPLRSGLILRGFLRHASGQNPPTATPPAPMSASLRPALGTRQAGFGQSLPFRARLRRLVEVGCFSNAGIVSAGRSRPSWVGERTSRRRSASALGSATLSASDAPPAVESRGRQAWRIRVSSKSCSTGCIAFLLATALLWVVPCWLRVSLTARIRL
jgi:hypothetical protein